MYRGELFNSISHLVGSVLAVIGTSVLIAIAVTCGSGGARRITALTVYGGMLVMLYLSSTLYHSFRDAKVKNVLHVFDHCAIYLLIAGTYTPFTLITLRGRWGWTLFAIVWALALAGIAKDVFLRGRYRAISVVLYIVMGWLVVIAFGPLQRALPPSGVAWLMAGGIVYTSGVLFYALSRHVPHAHGVWHLFVLAGSICHYIVVLRYVAA
jgi:hemolysin III